MLQYNNTYKSELFLSNFKNKMDINLRLII